eukprot:Lithocolla_globosa_v1_NODE_3627_length_1621_cov_4.503831.p1 type:complete len:510 gc:universal NODE_3627_length_1621_cov_4.503831:49-1578(+)
MTKQLTREEVAKHNSEQSAWMIIDSKVYDVTRFAMLHPGGEQELLQHAGEDVTDVFYELHRSEVLDKFGPKFLVGQITGEKPKIVSTKGQVSKVPYGEVNWLQGWKSPYITESHLKFEKAVRQIHDEYADEWRDIEEKEGPVPLELVQKFAKTNLLWCSLGPGKHLKGVMLPSDLRGEDYDFFHELILNEQMTRLGLRAFQDGFSGGLAIGLPPVLNFGPPAMRDKVVPEVVSGSKRICLAITEPYVGSDVAGLKCTAKKSADGKHYIVNGVKKWITGGMYADYFTTAVRTGGKGGLGVSLLLIPRGEGVSTKPIKTSYSSSAGTAYVMFENARVPVENIIGKEGQGFKAIMSNFNHERWGMIAANQRHARLITEECFKWANQRIVFGKRLIEQPVIRFKLSKMVAELESVQAWLHEITHQMNLQGYQTKAIGSPIALCKMQGTRVSHYIADEAVQIFGGRGITKTGMGRHIEHFQRAIKFSAILGGSEEILGDYGIRESLKTMPNSRL